MKVVALILAGGQGTRLGVLTENIAKPAIPFGGKYRIIDFTLSNCVNSGIYIVGVLTQYKPHVLNQHIGIGKHWDLDRKDGGLTILPPYTAMHESDWYRGTSDAVTQNIDFVDQYSPQLVLILSGDHVYAMDYNEILEFHMGKNADGTIACMEVPISEASRFGLMVTDPDWRIVDFQEKPKVPKSNLASLGIYVFRWDFLREALLEDEKDPNSSHDFGRDIIPKLVSRDGVRLYAFRFDGYWRDVGTLPSYWETNLELTRPLPLFNLYDPSWSFYTHTEEMPPAYISESAQVVESLVSEGAEIFGKVESSVIFQGVEIGNNAVIRRSVIMTRCEVMEGAVIEDAIIAERSIIGRNVKIGLGEDKPSEYDPRIYYGGITVVGFDTVIPDGVEIGKNVVIGNRVREEDFTDRTIPSGGFVFKKKVGG